MAWVIVSRNFPKKPLHNKSVWRRLTEQRTGGAKSVFHFDVHGSVAKSTHAGIPWLRFIRQRLGSRAHLAVRRLGHPG